QALPSFPTRRSSDLAGSTLVVLGLLQGGQWGWLTARTVAVIVIGVVVLGLFGWRARRVDYPILDLKVLGRRIIWATTLVSFMVRSEEHTSELQSRFE